jgi:hypothetical protein
MFLIRYVMSRIFVFWLSVAVLVYGWFFHAKFVTDGYNASEALVKVLTRVDQTGKTETVIVHVLHLDDLIVIGFIMLIVTLVLTAGRNLVLGSSRRRMTIARAIGHLLVLLLLSYAVLAAVWWYDARLVNSWFDTCRALVSQAAAAIDPRGQLEIVLRTLGVSRHLVVGCLMLGLALAWEMLKWVLRGMVQLVRPSGDSAPESP